MSQRKSQARTVWRPNKVGKAASKVRCNLARSARARSSKVEAWLPTPCGISHKSQHTLIGRPTQAVQDNLANGTLPTRAGIGFKQRELNRRILLAIAANSMNLRAPQINIREQIARVMIPLRRTHYPAACHGHIEWRQAFWLAIAPFGQRTP